MGSETLSPRLCSDHLMQGALGGLAHGIPSVAIQTIVEQISVAERSANIESNRYHAWAIPAYAPHPQRDNTFIEKERQA